MGQAAMLPSLKNVAATAAGPPHSPRKPPPLSLTLEDRRGDGLALEVGAALQTHRPHSWAAAPLPVKHVGQPGPHPIFYRFPHGRVARPWAHVKPRDLRVILTRAWPPICPHPPKIHVKAADGKGPTSLRFTSLSLFS